MAYKFFNNSVKTWQAMFEAISNAKESVYIEMYMFEADIKNYDFFLLLEEKAKSGIRIKMILDSLGSRNAKGKVEDLKKHGIEVFFISHFLHHTHRKILIVDESVAFIGGVNFSENAKRWDDLAVKVQGGLVKHIVRSFAKVYKICGGTDIALLAKNKSIVPGKMRAWLIEHFPLRNKFRLKRIYQQKLRGAKKSIILITPYFVPNHWLSAAIDQAIMRGVEVKILMPKSTDIGLSDRVNYFYISRVAQTGAKFYLNPRMNHAKAMIVDGVEAIVGSHNLDFLSFTFNDEIAVSLKDVGSIRKILDIASRWEDESVLFDPDTYKPTLLDYILLPFISLFARVF